ncbi:MAG TPA: alcohol dehydrogenase catalytic domain-containing protein [Anaerolineae bacterium]|nr:alcohol dehydrogenase catalytic domain-containing protein [Anaerolineae bacterium]
MRVLHLMGPREFQWEDEPTPQPGPGEVRLQVQAVGICASDIHTYAHGRIGDVTLESPLVLGHEASARVDALGPDVEGLIPGQLVAVDPAMPCNSCEFCLQGNPNFCKALRFFGNWPHDGALRELLNHPAELVYPVPESFTSIDTAMLEPLGVGLHALQLGHIHPGDHVAVHGCGPIGLLVIKLARLAGAGEIIAIEPIPHRRQMATEVGADIVLPLDNNQVHAVREITHGRGVDKVFEAAGENDAVRDAVEVCKPGGRVILIGIPAEDVTSFRASAARHKGLTILVVRRMKHTYPRAISLVKSGKIDFGKLVTHQFPFQQAAEAFRLVEFREDKVIKAIVKVSA